MIRILSSLKIQEQEQQAGAQKQVQEQSAEAR
jgi:hypothetical protein